MPQAPDSSADSSVAFKLPQVRGRLFGSAAKRCHGIRQACIVRSSTGGSTWTSAAILNIHTAILHGQNGATSDLNGACTGHLDEIRPADCGIFLFKGFEEVHGLGQASIGTIADLWLMDDGSIGTPTFWPGRDALVEVPAVVPC